MIYLKWNIIFLNLLFYGLSGFGQAYNSSLVKNLLPEIKGKDTIEIISFIEMPSFEAESAIRIVSCNDHCTFEGRFFKKNYWYDNYPYIKEKKEIPSPDILFFSSSVSNEFAKKMKSAFSNAMKIKDPELRRRVDEKTYVTEIVNDGTIYVLRLNESGMMISKQIPNPKKEDGRYNLIMSCSQMAMEINNQSFEELKFKDIFNQD